MGQSHHVSSGVSGGVHDILLALDLGLAVAGPDDGLEELTIEINLHSRVLFGVESEGNLIKPRSSTDNLRLILLPEEVVGAGVDGLHFPGHLIFILQVTALPNPSTNAILGTKCLVN